jgi:thiamine biosynthesis lipoprotein ApbE
MSVAMGRASWQALGTSVELLTCDHEALDRARAIVVHQLEEIDRACSRFREDSEITRVNARAGRTTAVSPLLLEALEVALRAAELTDGDVDPTLGVALELAGYDRDWRLLEQSSPEDSPHLRATNAHQPSQLEERPREHLTGRRTPRILANVRGWKAVELDRNRATLRIPRGMKLDLGATAKAWAADRAARAVHEQTGCGVLLSLGGDISTAGTSPTGGWRIHVTDDHRSTADAAGQTISISGGGIATSSTTVRRWRHEGHTMHHIIDPSTAQPVAEVWRTVSVAAIDCTEANIAATGALVRGRRASQWLTELGLPARLVGGDGEVFAVGSWPREEIAS